MTQGLRRRARRLFRALITLFGYDVFISYARVDGRRYARALQRRLEADGVVTYFDAKDMQVGNSLDSALATALHRSRLFVLVATEGARVSPYVSLELEAFLKEKGPIVPLNFGDSYTPENWPRLSALKLVWLDEPMEALTTGAPARQVVIDIRRHLKSSGSRRIVKRLMLSATVLLVALIVGVLWASLRAEQQGRERDAQRLAARAQLGFDVDQNPLLTLAYGVAALRRHDSLEATDAIARVLPYTRTPLGGVKIARWATRITFSASGRYLLVTGSTDVPSSERVVVVLTAADMTERLRLQRRALDVAVAIRRDEDVIAVADRGACVSIVAIDTRQLVRCLAHAGVTQIAFSDDGRFMSSVGRPPGAREESPQTVKIWDANSWQLVAGREVPSFVQGMTFSPSGLQLLIGLHVWGTRQGGSACLWSFQAGQACTAATIPSGESMGFSVGPDASALRFGGDQRAWIASSAVAATVTDVGSGDVLRATAFDGPTTIAPTVGSAEPILLTRPPGGVATLWRTARVASAIGHLVHPGDVRDARFSPDARTIVTTSSDGIVRLWDAGLRGDEQNDFIGSNRLAALLTHGVATLASQQNRAETVVGIAVSPDSKSLATAGNDGWVRVWRLDAEPDTQRGRHGQWVGGVAAARSPDTFITASDYYGRVWTLNPLREVARLQEHRNNNQGVYVSDDGSLIATSGDDSRVLLFDGNYRYLREITHGTSEGPIRAALAGSGKVLLTGASDAVRLWDTSNGDVLGELKRDAPVGPLAMSPNGAVAAIGSQRSVTMVDATNGLVARAERASSSPVTVLRFDRTGSRLVIGTEDGVVKITDTATGREIRIFRHVDRVSSAVFSPDNRLLLTGSHDRTARVWDLDAGTEIARQTRSFRIDAVGFIDGSRLIVAGGQNYVQVSRWRVDDLLALACNELRNVQGESWMRLIGNEISPDICSPGRQ